MQSANTPHRTLVNGSEAEQITLFDRGLHYGDGLFETIAWARGHPQSWDGHMRRLARGCERLGLPTPELSLLAHEARLCAGIEQRCVLKLILTRGSGERGYRVEDESSPTRIWLRYPWPDYPDVLVRQGVTVRFCSMRLSRQPAFAGIKHLNRLEQILARMEWREPAIHEGLMLDTEGWLIEGTMSNLFLENGGTLRTPDLSQCGVWGVTRERVIAAAMAKGVAVRAEALRPDDLYTADHAFLCNSVIGIWPIRWVRANPGRELSSGGLAGELAAALAA